MSQAYTLQHEVKVLNTAGQVVETITCLTLRRLTGRDMRAIANAQAKGAGEGLAAMVCASAGIAPSTFDLLDAEDITQVGEVVAGFIGGALQTGKT